MAKYSRRRSRARLGADVQPPAPAPTRTPLTTGQKATIVGVGLPVLAALGFGGLIVWRILRAYTVKTENPEQPEEEKPKEFVQPTDPKCQNVESRMDTPAGCGEMSVLAYNRGDREQVRIAELPGRPGFYLQRSPIDAWSAFQRLEAAAKAAGQRITVNSSFRTMAKQQELYSKYLKGKGNLAAKPGRSNHQYGITIDLNVKGGAPSFAWMAANGPKYGWHKTVPSEDWHWEYKPATDTAVNGLGRLGNLRVY